MSSENKNNSIIAQKLSDVNFCIAELAARGLLITAIEIKDRKPLITIVGHNESPGGLKGGNIVRTLSNGSRKEIYATQLEGCQVQWEFIA